MTERDSKPDMDKIDTITGAGGGKGDDGGDYYRQPDTIRSTATARLLVALSAGPVKGLATADPQNPGAAAASILFDGVPLGIATRDDSGNAPNAGLVAWATTPGDSAQEPIGLKGFNAVETTENINAKISHAVPWQRRAPTSANRPDAARITLRFPRGLVRQNSAGIFGTSVALKIERSIKRATGTQTRLWQTALTPTIGEKQTAFFEVQFLVDLRDGEDGVLPQIRVHRLTADNDGAAAIRDDVHVTSVTWIHWDHLSYPGVSLLAMRIGAGSFAGRLPRLSVDLKGRLVQVPTNYDPETRTHAGFWDGSFKTAFCNNPAWVLYDLLTDTDWGLGIDPGLIEKYDLGTIAKYADEKIADGRGGSEPRFLFDGVIARRVAASDIIGQICAAMRVSYFWSGGRLRFIQDSPAEPVLWLTNAHVEGGNFVYTGPSAEAAYSHALVSFTDAENGYGISVEAESNAAILSRHGYRAREVALIGCTRRSQARRHARWLLEVAALGLHGISWQASIDHLAENPVRPGDIVRVHDAARLGAGDSAGRVYTADDESLTAALDIAAGITTATLDYEDAENNWQTGIAVRIESAEVHGRTLTKITPTSGAWQHPPATGGALLLHTANNATTHGEDYRVIAVRERDNHRFEISALRYDAAIYDRIESGLKLDSPALGSRDDSPLPPARNLVLRQPSAIAGHTGGRDVHAGWTPPADARIALWRLTATGPDGEAAEVEVHRPPAILPALQAGAWVARLAPLDWAGREGAAITADFTVAEVAPPRDGRDGEDGQDGRDGEDGADGIRGSVIARATTHQRRWSDTAARAAITALAGGGPVDGDLVTLSFTPQSGTGESWAETRQWKSSGGSGSWVIVADVLSGGAIAPETIPASRLKFNRENFETDTTDDKLKIKAVSADIIKTGVLQNPDYRSGQSGFSINLDGSAEFNDARIRGDLTGSHITGSRITGSLIVASTTASPTESGGRFLTLETPRLLASRRKLAHYTGAGTSYYANTITVGPIVIHEDWTARRHGDARNLVVASDDPHGDNADKSANDYYSRFWARAPLFTITLRCMPTDGRWGSYITNGSVRVRLITESGREIAKSRVVVFTSRSSDWSTGARDASLITALSGAAGFYPGAVISASRSTAYEFESQSPGSRGRSYTDGLTVTGDMRCNFTHAWATLQHNNAIANGKPPAEVPPMPVVGDGLKAEFLFDFGSLSVTNRIVRRFVANDIIIMGTTHE